MLSDFSVSVLFFSFRLLAGTAWTAGSSDFDQYIEVDLQEVKNVTEIDTKGRSHSDEYVKEYSISYGVNGVDYSIYKENDGSAKVFKSTCPYFAQKCFS